MAGNVPETASRTDLEAHKHEKPQSAHGIWSMAKTYIDSGASKFVPLAARVNLSLTDPQVTWAAKDITALVSARSGVAIVNITTPTGARWATFQYRPFGSTADPLGSAQLQFSFTDPGTMTMKFYWDTVIFVPLDYTTKKFEYKSDSEGNAAYYLIGYIEQGV
jgi:hypothetical protein